jgi:hypothetical protein
MRRSKISRRTALGLSSVAVLSSLTNEVVASTGGKRQIEEAKSLLVVIGPYPFAEVYKACGFKFANQANDPPEEEILKLFKDCSVHVVDRKTRNAKGEWKFDGKDGYPAVSFNGPTAFKTKDKKGREFTFTLRHISTHHDTSWANGDVTLDGLNFGFEVVRNGLILVETSRSHMQDPRSITYDIDGKLKKSTDIKKPSWF